MATLTYNPDQTPEGEFTPDEQDSIAVGEALAEQESQLLAGKFEDAEQLEKAYVELQRKLGSQDNEQPQEETQEVQQEEVAPVDSSFLDTLWEEAVNNNYSQGTLEQLRSMDPQDIAQQYLDYRSSVNESSQAEVLSSEDVDALQGIVGGADGYGNMMQWAQSALTDAEIQLYDNVMEKGDPGACFFAVQALASRYGDASVGTQGDFVSGGTPRNTVDSFRSQAEVVQAMHDPRYDNDPAYRDDVMQKLSRSNDIMF